MLKAVKVNKFEYAIETLRIEEYRLKDQLRIIGKNCDEVMSVVGNPDGVKANLQSVLEAIKILGGGNK